MTFQKSVFFLVYLYKNTFQMSVLFLIYLEKETFQKNMLVLNYLEKVIFQKNILLLVYVMNLLEYYYPKFFEIFHLACFLSLKLEQEKVLVF